MPASTPLTGRKRIVHHLDTPFSTVAWPEISFDDQDAILEMLCNLLNPIGQHKRHHVKPSKGKRAGGKNAGAKQEKPSKAETGALAAPPRPELSAHIDVGFNSITRKLEETARARKSTGTDAVNGAKEPYSMVFVARGNQSPAFNCHFPKMVGAASRGPASAERTRLIGFSKPCSERLSSVLGVARVSSVAVARDAPGAEALWAFVRKIVSPVDISWLDGSTVGAYQPTRIASVETTVGGKKAKTADFGPPPPSARQYGGLGRFGGPSISNGQQPVLGNAAADFLRRASKEEPTKLVGTPVAAERGPSEKTTGLTSAQSQAESATTCLFQETKPEGVEPGSILDTFFLLVNGEQIPKKDEQPITKEGAEQPDEQSTLVEASGTDTQCEAVESSITSLEESPMHQAFPASATGPDVSGQVIESSQATMEKQAAKKLCPRAASFVPSQAAAPIAEAQPQHAVASTLHNSEWNIQSFANNGVTPNAALPLPFNIPNTPVNPFIPNMVPQNTAHVQNVDGANTLQTDATRIKGAYYV
ncbi:ribonuclease P/MRP protein subunit POP3 [Purpureocillium lavendulum]|uniref:Ribonuclease P/MRP protein subunit POP3 n=1 Tax=Purpureocillium lavendulum TaxID=1247861 RepID=A0AB34G0X0_9HYPO|nr:ribonuclease P/MRP protein subunit POP3 [Purpureocillium lavendulum]